MHLKNLKRIKVIIIFSVGCLAPDFQGGAVFPDMAEEGQAPYEIGAVVEFQCLETAGALVRY